MALVSIDPYKDARLSHKRAHLNGRTYHYVVGKPPGEKYKGTVVLVHGFPDLWYSWRKQIPILLKHGLRIVAIDCMGYGGTDTPRVPPDSISLYGFKRAADDIAELARQLSLSKMILGGHDWGGMIVSRVCLYHPSLVEAVFSVGTPYLPPSAVWEEFDTMVQSKPSFQYQRHFGSPELEAVLEDKDSIRHFFNAAFGGQGPNGELGFSTNRALTENWEILGKQTLLNDKEFDYYVDQFTRNGMHAPLNYYRNRRQNYEDELPILPDTVIDVPFLFIQSLQDPFLPPSMSEGMERFLPQLRRREVDSGHFSHVLAYEVVNAHICEWLDEEVFAGGERSAPK